MFFPEEAKMFYNQMVLTKKGPLAKVWLAAHWERKLTKAQVFETSIENSVQGILHPKVKLALRTSGHLLLGIVRIYSKKAKYLLSDCNDALAKLKLAFRPSVIEANKKEAKTESKETSQTEKFAKPLRPDITLEDLSEDELTQRISQTARGARIEDITLKEDLLSSSRADMSRSLDDNFGDVGFEDLDMLAEDGLIDIDLMDSQEEEDVVDELDILAPVALPTMPTPVMPLKTPLYKTPAYGPDDQIDEAVEMFDTDTAPIKDAEGFTLPPMDLFTPTKAHRRKRKLIVDELKNITGEAMKQWLNDPNDLVCGLDLGAPTEIIMTTREIDRVEKHAQLPSSFFEAAILCDNFSQNLNFKISAPPVARLEQFSDFLGVEVVSRLKQSEIMRTPAPTPAYSMDTGLSPARSGADFEDDDLTNGFDVDELEIPAEQNSSKDKKNKKRKLKDVEEAISTQEEEDGHQDDEDEHMNVKTRHLFNIFKRVYTKRSLPKSESSVKVTFDELVAKEKNRKELAKKFYCLLVMKKLQAVEVTQKKPFGDIKLMPGANFEEFK